MKSKIQKLVENIKAQGYKNICFFQPVHAITGATTCKVQMAKYLANYTDLNVYFCDLVDGHPRTLIKDEKKIKFIPYEPELLDFPLKEKCVIFTTSTRVILLKNMHKDNKIIFWHNETLPCAWDLLLINNETPQFFDLIKKNNAIMYHDWSSRDSLNRYNNGNFTNNDFYYVSIPKKEQHALGDLINEKELNIAFLSRLSQDKIQSLFYLVRNLYKIKIDKKIKLHIIGDGICRQMVELELEEYRDKIEIVYTGTIAKEKLDEYLINNIDLLFGVGTCVIESSALKIPTAVLLMNSKEIKDNEAYWYFESKEYCTGITVEQKKDYKVNYNSIEDIVKKLCVLNAKRELGEKCFQYYLDNHGNYEKLVLIFLNQILKATLLFGDLKKCIRYVPYSLFQVHYFCLFGMKLFKKVVFAFKVHFYFFGCRIFKKASVNNITKYYLFGLLIAKIIKKTPYNFPNSMGSKVHYANKNV